MITRHLLTVLRWGLMGVLLFSTSCNVRGQPEGQNIPDQSATVVADAQVKRENRLKQLQAMDVGQLVEELASESQKGVEPFNSMPYAEIVSRGENAASALAPLLTKADRSSLLGLLALKKISPTRYESLDPAFRVSVLIDALKNSEYFNTWGLPHVRWEEAAQAILEEGVAAQPSLVPLLDDKRDAPVWGSEDFMEYQTYKYRVKDYAWALLIEIRKEQVIIAVDPAERDRQIQKLLDQLR